MNIHLIRHGETAHNRSRIGLGLEDVPLTALGEAQAAALATYLANRPLDSIHCSPLQRAAMVAERLANDRHCRPEVRRELIELDVGETEGMEFPIMRAKYPEFMARWAAGDTTVRMPGGESIDDVVARLRPYVDSLRALEAESIAVVSHNFITKLLVCLLLDLPIVNFRNLQVDLASVTTISIPANGRSMLMVLNDTCHLLHLEQIEGGL